MNLFAKIKSRMRRSSKSRRPHSTSKTQWRARHYDLWLTRRKKLVLTARKFRTNPDNRAKSFRQLVIPLRFLPVKELAIRYKRTRKQDVNQLHRVPVRTLVPTLMVVAGISGVVYFGMQIIPTQQTDDSASFNLPTPAEQVEADEPGLDYSEPTRLRIDSIDVDTEIMTVGKEPDNTMEVPPIDEYIAGWYRHGPTPGEVGPSIIVGHVDNREGPSVFWRLNEMGVGDRVAVTREDGEVVEFAVYEVRSFNQNNFPTATVYGDREEPELRLITCGGEFDWREGRYTHNTVVFAKIVSER